MRGLIAAGIGAVLVVIAWMIGGWWALLLAVVAGAWATTVALTGDWVPDRDSVLIGVVAVPRVIANLGRSTGTPHAGPVISLAIAFLPLVGFVGAALGSAMHHSSLDAVCKDYYAFEAHQSATANSYSMDDNEWFSLLDHLGRTAADYGGGSAGQSIRSAGQAAQVVARGTGSGLFVTASVGQAESAIAPIAGLCVGLGD